MSVDLHTGQGDGVYVMVVEDGGWAQTWISFALFDDEPAFAGIIRPQIEHLRAMATGREES